MPELKRDALEPPTPACVRPAQDASALNTSLITLRELLARAQLQEAALLSALLRKEPVRADMHAVLAEIEPERALPILDELSTVNLPDQRAVLDALLTDRRPGSAQTLRATVRAMHRQELLAAIFHPDRVHSLRKACQSLTKEPT